MSYKEDFIAIYEQNIHREGADALLEYLKKSDFFTAPASSRFHLAEEGGLAKHSLNVYFRLKELVENEARSWAENITDETVAICGLLHDVCKISMYKTDYRNQKQPDGSWAQVPYYTIDEALPYGHGEKSVYIINGFMRLTREEAIAINWHMGSFDERNAHGGKVMAQAYEKFPFAVLVHAADLMASYLDEASR